ncbi:MAG TPA: NAD(P)-binding domain-containing protein [Longimicrobiales bacterium]|nr:NAD(P)-binding domain-containing protein [Longimicrobiales bacterium]
MRFAILGTGIVGSTLGSALLAAGHEVRMGSRSASNPRAAEWARDAHADGRASHGTFADAAAFGDIVFNCTSGVASLAALEATGRENLRGKILIDVANPLDFSRGMPPSLTVCNTDSLGEQIQRALPETRVVKTLNTINCLVMVDPGRVPGDHVVFLSGNDAAAKQVVAAGLSDWFGWDRRNIIDLGDITSARGTEMFLPLWVRLMMTVGSADFNLNLVRARPASLELGEPTAVH